MSFSRRWLECLTEASETLPAQLVHCANLVAATTDGLAGDPHFGEGAAVPAAFDLLVLDEAHGVTEAEFLAVARRARRWVLVGEPSASAPAPASSRPQGRSGRPALRPGFFQRLWQRLHATPARLPFAWVRAEGKLCCRLRPLTAEQQQWVEKEALADCPDIELLILAQPRTEPVLVEVRFPTATPIRQAKEYIHRELQEVPTHCRGHSLDWQETEDAVRLRLDLAPHGWACCTGTEVAAGLIVVALGEGIEELVRLAPDEPVPFETLGFQFQRAAGSTRPRAEEWVHKHLGLRDLGRSIVLEQTHRMRGKLAGVLANVLSLSSPPVACRERNPEEGGAGELGRLVRPAGVGAGSGCPAGRGAERGPDFRGRAGRGGAGFELDLSDATHSEHLPGNLPRCCRAAVWSTTSRPRRSCRPWKRWRLTPPSAPMPPPGKRDACADPALVVTALYAAQVQLLHHLIGQSAALARAGLSRTAEGRFRLPGGDRGAGRVGGRAGGPAQRSPWLCC